jgi:hypothetical protein
MYTNSHYKNCSESPVTKGNFMLTDKQKIHFSLTNEALAVIDRRAPGPGKRGEWISAALIDYDRVLAGVPADGEQCGALESIEARLRNLELMVSHLIQRNGADHE